MEDTHRDPMASNHDVVLEWVLILVLMEDTHRVSNCQQLNKVVTVLILVLMEDTHRVFEKPTIWET